MSLKNADRVKETSTTTGTGTYSLAGAVTGFQTFVAGVGNSNTCHYVAEDGTNWEIGLGTVTDGAPDTLARTLILASSNAGSAVNWGAGTRNIFCAEIAHADTRNPRAYALSADYTNSSTTGTEVTGLSVALQPGTYRFSYALIARSATTTTGLGLGVNFTGTHTVLSALAWWLGTGASASTGVISNVTPDNPAAEQIYEGGAINAESTTNPNMGVMTGFSAGNADHLMYLEGVITVTVAGDFELWCASEVGASEVRLQAGSNVLVTQVN